MSDINQVKLRGRAGGDAEVKTLPNATLVTVRIATGESYTDRSGSKVDRSVLLPSATIKLTEYYPAAFVLQWR